MDIAVTISKINQVKTMPELDALRGETVEAMQSGGKEAFELVQNAFRKKKNKLNRIPLSQRDW